MKIYKIVIYYILSSLIVINLANNFLKFTGSSISDYYWYIQIAQKIRIGELPLIPFYYSRSLIYLIVNVTTYPPTYFDVIIITLINQLLVLIAIVLIVNLLFKIYYFNISKNLLIFVLYFYPGLIFLSATFRYEIFSLFFLYLVLLYIYVSRNKLITISLVILSMMVRPSTPLAVILIFANLNSFICENKIFNFIKFYFKNTIYMIIILLLIEYFISYFYKSGWYNYTYYGGTIRDYFNVESNSDILKIFLKIPLAYILDSTNISIFSSSLNNTENINYITGTIRCIIFATIFCKLFIFDNKNIITILKIYLVLTIANISLVGFYQTRYLIIFDLLILAACFIGNKRLPYGKI